MPDILPLIRLVLIALFSVGGSAVLFAQKPNDGEISHPQSYPSEPDSDGDKVSDDMEEFVTNTDPHSADTRPLDYRLVLLPEPLHFDLVRGLAARRGEFEANALWTVIDSQLKVAPEVEYAVADGLAFEFEVPMHYVSSQGLSPYSVKLAAQMRFAGPNSATWIHGAQTIVQTWLADGHTEVTLLWLLGAAPNRVVSFSGMCGLEAPIAGLAPRFVANPSFFARTSAQLVVGVENNIRYAYDIPFEWLILPQAHWEPILHFRIQLGAGPMILGQRVHPYVSGRIILEL